MATEAASPFDVQRYLIRNERIVWTARPDRRYFLKYVLSQDPSRLLGYYFFFAGLFFAFMPLLLFSLGPTPPPGKGEPPILVFSIFGLCFAAIGYALSFGRRRRAIKQYTNTAYYLTNHRALIVTGAEHPTLITIELRRVPQISISLVDGGVGNIVFGDADPALQRGFWRIFDPWGWWGRWDRRRLEGFIAIPDAEDIMRRIAQIEDELK